MLIGIFADDLEYICCIDETDYKAEYKSSEHPKEAPP
jgi:hypothetical protein